MKALTLYQPYAALIAAGMKRIETRSWPTSYRGPLAIHAAKHIPPEYRNLWLREPFQSALVKAGVVTIGPGEVLGSALNHQIHYERYYLGCVIATCELVDCAEIVRFPLQCGLSGNGLPEGFVAPPAEPELSFGDYTPGRYAWLLANVQPLSEPVPVRGRQGLWEWEGEL